MSDLLQASSLPTLRILAAQLQAAGHQVLEADTADRALIQFQVEKPGLVPLDVEMPGHDGDWLASRMRASEAGGWTPIIFLSSRDKDQDLWQGIESGGDDYLIKPVSATVLQAKLRAMQRLRRMQTRLIELSDELRLANEPLTHLSNEDALTGLPNRRPRDCAARYGGEEFALILPGTPRSGAMTFARAALRTLALTAIAHPNSAVAPYLTLSGGITTCMPDESTSVEGLLRRADDALYTAKSRGRNCFFSFEMQMDTHEQRGSAKV